MSVSIDLTQRMENFQLRAKIEAPSGVTVVFGPSGSGKTTLLRSVAGLNPGASGRVIINGQDISSAPVHKRRIGYVFQNTRLFQHLSVAKNLGYASRLGATITAQKWEEVVQLLQLAPLLPRHPATLSGGEAQRVALGRALLSDPRALCMDEPLSALDHRLKQRILPFLERLRETTGIPILYVTHDPAEMARLADHIVLMKAGETVLSGAAQDVLSDPSAVPILGVRAAGTVIDATIQARGTGRGLTQVSFDGGTLILPDLDRPGGRKIRLRVAAQDIILATTKPTGLSALNILEGQISKIFQGSGPGVMVQFQVGPTRFLARVTRHSYDAMPLAEGMTIYAIVKASAFDPAGIGT